MREGKREGELSLFELATPFMLVVGSLPFNAAFVCGMCACVWGSAHVFFVLSLCIFQYRCCVLFPVLFIVPRIGFVWRRAERLLHCRLCVCLPYRSLVRSAVHSLSLSLSLTLSLLLLLQHCKHSSAATLEHTTGLLQREDCVRFW